MSGSGSRTKGIRYEHAVWVYLSQCVTWWWKIEKRNRSGYDGEDLLLSCSGFELNVECKDQKAMKLAEWMDQAKENTKEWQVPVVIHKRRGRSDVGQHYVTMEVDAFIKLMRRVPSMGEGHG